MGILDQLRKQADQKKSFEQQEVDDEQQKEHIYQAQILPKMQQIFHYLQELVEYLNYLEIPVKIENYSEYFPKLGILVQKNYKINTDGFGGMTDIDKLMQVNLVFQCVGDGEFEYLIHGHSAIEREISFLHAKHLSVKSEKMPGISGEESAKFSVQRRVPVRVRFEVDYDNSQIKMTVNNHLDFAVYIESWDVPEISDELLDVVARYILRKDSVLIKPSITDEHREVLRQKIAEIKKSENQSW